METTTRIIEQNEATKIQAAEDRAAEEGNPGIHIFCLTWFFLSISGINAVLEALERQAEEYDTRFLNFGESELPNPFIHFPIIDFQWRSRYEE